LVILPRIVRPPLGHQAYPSYEVAPAVRGFAIPRRRTSPEMSVSEKDHPLSAHVTAALPQIYTTKHIEIELRDGPPDNRSSFNTGGNMTFIRSTLAALAASLAFTASAQAQPAPEKKLVVADQSELIRNLLDASGEGETIGFDLELPNFAGGPAILEAMRAGALDLAYVGDTPPIQARASGTTLPILMSVLREVSEYHLVARPGLTVDRLEDLRGKRLSYIEGSGRQVYLIEALNRAGLTVDDVQLVPLRVADLPDAIRSSAVDVAVLQEPHVTRLVDQIGASRVPDPRERELLPGTWYFYARPEALADPAKRSAMGEFLGATIRAGQWSNENREEWGQHYYQSFQRISPEDTATILASQSPMVFQTSAEAIPHHQRLIDILAQAGALPEAFDAEGSFDGAFDPIIEAERPAGGS
jgi:sulfonate transport system substrate-binding protein